MDKPKVETRNTEGELNASPETTADDAEQLSSMIGNGSHHAMELVQAPPPIPWNVLFPPGHPMHDPGRV
jgi:hypothetical protein